MAAFSTRRCVPAKTDARFVVRHIARPAGWPTTFFANEADSHSRTLAAFKNYGDSLGGPIRIPKIYDGRNKTFFFVTTEGYRQFDADTTSIGAYRA